MELRGKRVREVSGADGSHWRLGQRRAERPMTVSGLGWCQAGGRGREASRQTLHGI